MLIGGIQKSSLVDYRGNIAAVVFLQGCNFSCPYCHNPELVMPKVFNIYKEDEIFNFLKTRTGKLDGVVVSGGEPTLHEDLFDFIKKIKEMGFKIKLDTNGTNPSIVQKLIENNLIDYVAMDIKTSFSDYEKVTRKKVSIENIKTTAETILKTGIDYEFRTTVVKKLLRYNNFIEINEEFKNLSNKFLNGKKIKRYYLQKFQSSKHVDESYMKAETFEDEEFEKLIKLFQNTVEFIAVR